MYTSVWVYRNLSTTERQKMDIRRLYHSVPYFFETERFTLNLELADWLDQLIGKLLGIHLPLHTQYWDWRCMVLVPGFYIKPESRDFTITSSALGVCSKKQILGLVCYIANWIAEIVGKKNQKNKDWHRIISNGNSYTIPSVRCHCKHLKELILKAAQLVVMRSTNALTGWAGEKHQDAMWVKI